jgi:hypothetical protein
MARVAWGRAKRVRNAASAAVRTGSSKGVMRLFERTWQMMFNFGDKFAMNKTLVALAALAVAGSASAQSSVTIFGVVDAGISSSSNSAQDLNGPTFLNPTT